MSWILFSVFTYFFLASTNILDKIIRKHSGPFLVLFLNGLARIPFILTPLFFAFHSSDVTIISLAIFSGILSNIAFFPFLQALRKEQVSVLVPLWNFIPPLTLLMAKIFLDETLPLYFYFAFGLIFIGSVILSMKDFKGSFSKYALSIMILSSILYSVDSIILKYVSNFLNFSELLFYTGTGNIIVSFGLFFLANKNIKEDIKAIKQKKILPLYIIMISIGALFYLMSVQNVPISIFTVLGGFQSLFVAGIAFVTHKHLIKIDEKTDLQSIIIKAISILLMVVGLYFLQG